MFPEKKFSKKVEFYKEPGANPHTFNNEKLGAIYVQNVIIRLFIFKLPQNKSFIFVIFSLSRLNHLFSKSSSPLPATPRISNNHPLTNFRRSTRKKPHILDKYFQCEFNLRFWFKILILFHL